MFKITKIAAVALLAMGISAQAQQSPGPMKGELAGKARLVAVVPSIADQIKDGTFVPTQDLNQEARPKSRSRNRSIGSYWS